MPFLSFDAYPLWLNALVFLLAAGTIWFAGVRLERYADTISERTGLGQDFTGMLLLAGATSLPEVATTITAVALLNNPTLAVHNLLGGVALQTAILAVADRTKGEHGALTFFSPRFSLLIGGVGLLLLLQLTTAGITARGFPSVVSISAWPVLVFLAYLGVMYLMYRYQGQPRWTPSEADDVPPELDTGRRRPGARDRRGDEDETQGRNGRDDRAHRHSLKNLWLLFAGVSLVVLVGGWFATQSADVLAHQTGLGSAFLGATLLALATSLPELSTTIAASRNGRYSRAISNIFGSNAVDVSLLFLAELLYRSGTVIEHGGESVVFVAAIGAIMTSIYLWGLMERENRTVLGIGWDSAAVLVVYLGGMGVLYFMS
ncbi:MAG TPA: sodium:calcium antiporter [Candidatus Limnocylindria bacterium]|nr:sodium:calcium antiporter [Candidatus Limnocylindria bacterium]